jgi:predicted enzyme related to lactoylglutathione lyase
MTAPDARRAKEFYEAVLKVAFPEAHPGMWRATEITPPLGIMPSQGTKPGLALTFRVDDIAAALQRVRLAGGQAGEARQRPFGLLSECADDQGTTFRLWQPAG